MFARGQYSSTFKSRYVDFLPVSKPKEWFDCRLFAGGRYRRALHYLRRLPTLLQHSSIFSRISGVRSSTLATPGKHLAE